MKKLMIAAAMVCAAAAVHAASFDWNSSSKCYMPYKIDSIAVGDDQASATSGAYSKTIGKWIDTGASFTATIMLSYTGDSGLVEETIKNVAVATDSSGNIYVADIASTTFDLPASGTRTYDYSIVISGTYGDYEILSSAITGQALITPYSALQLTTGVPATWDISKEDPEPTPEPTSGLLMLIGMAGLALRRKQK